VSATDRTTVRNHDLTAHQLAGSATAGEEASAIVRAD
jgi:hypothetical protein